jgi:hypothetical protein
MNRPRTLLFGYAGCTSFPPPCQCTTLAREERAAPWRNSHASEIRSAREASFRGEPPTFSSLPSRFSPAVCLPRVLMKTNVVGRCFRHACTMEPVQPQGKCAEWHRGLCEPGHRRSVQMRHRMRGRGQNIHPARLPPACRRKTIR